MRGLHRVLATLALVLAWEVTAWDLAVAHRFGDASGFAWRDLWWTRSVLHDGGRWLVWALLLLMAVQAVRPHRCGPGRRERLFWLGATIAAMVLVPGIKRLSATSCPWDLAPFGGTAAYVPHWFWGVVDGGPGHCFPSGHAASAFAFLSLYFLWRPHRPARARRLLAGVLALGAAYGLTQVVRGAHFPSHVLWSAWLCGTLLWLGGLAHHALAVPRGAKPGPVQVTAGG